MTPSRPTSTLANNTTLLLPPLVPPSSPPLVYALKLTHDVVEALVNGGDDAFVKFTAENEGVISIPGSEPRKFSTRPIGEGGDSARMACYSRRGAALRIVGPITAEIDMEQRMNKEISNVTKKRTLEASSAGRTREVKVVHDLPVAPAKKPRVRKPAVEKRPRPTVQRKVNGGKVVNGKTRASVSPFRSPAVSPGTPNGLRVSPLGKEDLVRREVVQMLALGGMNWGALLKRVERVGGDESRLKELIAEVGVGWKGIYGLRDGVWGEVNEWWNGYNDGERGRVRGTKKEKVGGGISEERLEEMLGVWEREGVVGEGEEEMRKAYARWYPVYEGVIGRLEEMRKMFGGLEERLRECKSVDEKNALVRRIQQHHERYQERHGVLTKVVRALHDKLGAIRESLDDLTRSQSAE